jgi:hypothetical protein
MRHVVIDRFLDSADLIHADARWPARDWAGWFSYDPAYEAKRVSDLTAPLPPVLSMLLARMAQANLGAMLGMPDSVADLSLHGGGLFAYPRGPGLGRHQDADVHPRLGLARAWSAVLFVHPSWGDWGGELEFAGVPPLAPLPGRLVAFDCREAAHAVAPVRCPEGCERRCLALFGYLAAPGEGKRPRAAFEDARAASR